MTRLTLAAALVFVFTTVVRADSVGQIGTRVSISEETVTLIDPQGRPAGSGGGSDTAIVPGDILTLVTSFTPVPNNCHRGLGGYVTFYVPRNVEVVGVRFVDADGFTVPPHRGGLAADGIGPRGARTFDVPLVAGSLSQLYADTGVFYSTSPLTVRVPVGTTAGEEFISVFNGIEMTMSPTGAGGLQSILNASPSYAHSVWDYTQVVAMGAGAAVFGGGGTGCSPDMYGSPVAGPDTWYPFEATFTGVPGDIPDDTNVTHSDAIGPWQRIQTFGGEIGIRGAVPPMPDPGAVTRIGVPALDVNGDLLGVALSPDAPLSAFNAAAPSDPYTTAVRYALGELVVGDQYFAEISLRVLDLPLDPVLGDDIVCAEVFGGDCSAKDATGGNGGKDLAWRYFVPAPSCVNLSLAFDIAVDKLNALPGDTLTYTITGKNLSRDTQTNVLVCDCYDGALTLTSDGGSVAGDGSCCPDAGATERRWVIPELVPGEEFAFVLQFDVGGGTQTVNRAVYSSDAVSLPGFAVTAYTNIDPLTVIDLALEVDPVGVDAGDRVTYTATIGNSGTGNAQFDEWIVKLPAGFVYVTGSSLVDGGAVADPAIAGSVLTYTAGIVDVAPGASATLTLQVDVPVGTLTGVYTATIETWHGSLEDELSGAAPLLVGIDRSDAPVVSAPLLAGETSVTGTTSEAAGTTIRVQVNGNPVAETTSGSGGAWSAVVPTLFAGQHVTATAEAAGEVESFRSEPVIVQGLGGTAACNDGDDNDGDGLTDFPDDPDCVSAADPDETHTPACADLVDNDGDGLIDFGEDPGCSSLLDDRERGRAECADGNDNDGDGKIDFPDDPGCDASDDVSEGDVPACANGVDDDGDGDTDFPRDTGCASALDESEALGGGATADAGAALDAGAPDPVAPDAGGELGGSDAALEDPGGVSRPDTGCGCSVPGRADRTPGLAWLLLCAFTLGAARRRRFF